MRYHEICQTCSEIQVRTSFIVDTELKIRYYIRKYFMLCVFFFQYKFLQGPLTDRQVLSAAFSLSKLLKETNVEDVEEIGSRLMPLFAYLVEKKNLYSTNVPGYFKNTNYFSLVSRAFNGNDGQDNDDT